MTFFHPESPRREESRSSKDRRWSRPSIEERPMRLDEAVAKKIGMRVGADYIVLGSLTKIGNYISLDARLISITEDKPPLGVYTQHKGIDDVMVKIGDFAQDIGYKILGRRPMVGRSTGTQRSSYRSAEDGDRKDWPGRLQVSKRAKPSTSKSRALISAMWMETKRTKWWSWTKITSMSLNTTEIN